MVTAVWGKIDGNEVVFRRGEGNGWKATVPLTTAGQFIVELWAEDDAGNRAFFAKVLITFDPRTLRMSFSVMEFGSLFSEADVRSIFSKNDVRSIFSEKKYEKGGDC